MPGVSACANTPQCQRLLAAANNARQDWMTKHAASCRPNQPHSSICNQAYAYFQTKTAEWYSACCRNYTSEAADGADAGADMARAFEESKEVFGVQEPAES
jgi:hypothetical protein